MALETIGNLLEESLEVVPYKGTNKPQGSRQNDQYWPKPIQNLLKCFQNDKKGKNDQSEPLDGNLMKKHTLFTNESNLACFWSSPKSSL